MCHRAKQTKKPGYIFSKINDKFSRNTRLTKNGGIKNGTGCLKKNALIENRYKTPIKKLNWVESAVFLLINNHCDKGNTYLCLGECFMGVLGVFHKYFEGASRAFQKRF